MHIHIIRPVTRVCFVLLALAVAATAFAQAKSTKIDIQELQRTNTEGGAMQLALWLPLEYWEASMKDLKRDEYEALANALRPYNIFVVVNAKVGAGGLVTYGSEADTRADLRLRDSSGAQYLPIAEQKIIGDTQQVLGMLRPVFANMLGPMGNNMCIFVFPATNAKGERIANPTQEGSFSMLLGKTEFTWRLPLASFVPPKTCPKCGEKLSGAYKYCPYDGEKLP